MHFRSPEGVPYQPYGHHNHVNSNLDTFHFDIGGDLRLGQITYAYIDGACQGWLPRGEVIVDVARGFEYEPLRTAVNIEPGQRELTLRIKRWTNMNAQGWYSGDSHVHFVGAQGAHREAQGEDLDVVNLLQSQWGSLFTNTEDFTGRPSVSENGDSIVYVGQENRQHFYGHLILWGLKRPVMPWCTGEFGEAEIAGSMEATLSDWADQARAQGATVVAPHFGGLNGETAALVATGQAVRRRDAPPVGRYALGVLPEPQRRLPAAPAGRHGQDVQRRPGRDVQDLRQDEGRRGVRLPELVRQRGPGPHVPQRRADDPPDRRRPRAGRHRRAFGPRHGGGRGLGRERAAGPHAADRPQRRRDRLRRRGERGASPGAPGAREDRRTLVARRPLRRAGLLRTGQPVQRQGAVLVGPEPARTGTCWAHTTTAGAGASSPTLRRSTWRAAAIGGCSTRRRRATC